MKKTIRLSNKRLPKKWAGGALRGAVSGGGALATTGNPFLIGAGALVGFIGGGIAANKEKKAIKEAEERERLMREEMQHEAKLTSGTNRFADYAGGEGRGFGDRGFYQSRW
jgi:hypothetical protein